MNQKTVAVHAGALRDPATGGINTPIYTSTAYAYMDREENLYPRYSNTPTQRAVEGRIAALEHGEAGLLFSSGMGAMSCSILAHAGAGDHVVMLDALYGGTHHFATEWFTHFGIDCTFTQTSAQDVMDKVTPATRVIVIESPTNPLLEVVDIRKIAAFAREKGIFTIMDNTFATPINQTPLELGIDVVVHSGTKYLGGHSDLCCGAVVCSRERMEKISSLAKVLGPCLDPRLCYLLERSIKTLALRVHAQSENALAVARFLADHPAVAQVFYPGLETAPGHEIAKAQMSGFGAMLSFELRDKDPEDFLKRLKVIAPAISLGGVETTICAPCVTSHAKMTKAEQERVGVRDSLLRLSVGAEEIQDLTKDLEQALTDK